MELDSYCRVRDQQEADMSTEADNETKPLAAPMVKRESKDQQSLDVEGVDMALDGVQGDAVVFKGRSNTSVKKLRKPKDC
jgi:hypothetical protein